MCKLHFNPSAFKAMFMQDRTHCMAKAVTSSTAVITDHLDNFVDAGFTHRLADIVTTRKQERIASGKHF